MKLSVCVWNSDSERRREQSEETEQLLLRLHWNQTPSCVIVFEGNSENPSCKDAKTLVCSQKTRRLMGNAGSQCRIILVLFDKATRRVVLIRFSMKISVVLKRPRWSWCCQRPVVLAVSSVSFLSAGSQERACRLQFIPNDLLSAAVRQKKKKNVEKHFHLFIQMFLILPPLKIESPSVLFWDFQRKTWKLTISWTLRGNEAAQPPLILLQLDRRGSD